MTLNVTFSTPGRGAWTKGANNLDGTKDGPYFRSSVGTRPRIGLDVARKARDSVQHNVHINDYAIWRGAMEIQRELRRLGAVIDVDGIWGPATDKALRDWQRRVKTDWRGRTMKIDGIYGQQTSRTMWEPRLKSYIRNRANQFAFMPSDDNIEMLVDYTNATVVLESGWDISAVGWSTPRDLGLCQINTSAHNISLENVFNPNHAFPFKINFVLQNFNYSLGDYQIAMAAYNVGQGGVWNWHKAGRPSNWAAANYLRALRPNLTHPKLIEATNI